MQTSAAIWKRFTGWSSLEGQWLRRKHFTAEVLAQIAERIRLGEQGHTGELMVAIEAVSPEHEPASRMRALEVFGRLRVWDTPRNTGVLLYLALDRHSIEIVADRGIAAGDDLWEQVSDRLQSRLQNSDYAAGVLAAVEDIEKILAGRCPPGAGPGGNPDDLPNEPVLL
ncbi:TPM domain-containing protein [Pusillimonas sp. MFBS29]|uniref:TPM domain-containing protein n=1 Tax=Pusillimonas sp. MFBS29 TaxID=2886690 RepID=UPI001D11AF40|nr:TPM domain-containing protein [Pusillimonas sp. MFBS29]MCC2596263.1 TPM domain-containing protein [Pusillimonas sp. MFBS29]